MKKAFLLLLLIIPVVHGESFEDYTGSTQWRVGVSEDETGCGGSVETETIVLTLKHEKAIVNVGDWGHGSVSGSLEGNTISLVGRTIPDGSGQSKLYPGAIKFTSDCANFVGGYKWDYSDKNMRCSGATILRGARLDGKECPVAERGADPRQAILDARKSTDNKLKEQQYKDVLAKDPTNFWANWDMAELRKKQGDAEYFKYFDKAVNNKNVYEKTRAELQRVEAERLGLPKYPTPETSPLLRMVSDEIQGWSGGFIHELKVPPEEKTKEGWGIKLWRLISPVPDDVARKIVIGEE